MGSKKKWGPEEKLVVVLDGLKGRPVVKICREYGISQAPRYYKWREEAVSGMREPLQDKLRKEWRDKSWEVERNRLFKMIGEQQLIIDIQKNFRGVFKASKRHQIAQKLVNGQKILLKVALRAMFLSKALYYYTPKNSPERRKYGLDGQLSQRLRSLQGYELTCGYRKVTHLLKSYNHKKVYRHMKELNMFQPKKLKKKKLICLLITSPLSSNIRREGNLTYVWEGTKINYL